MYIGREQLPMSHEFCYLSSILTDQFNITEEAVSYILKANAILDKMTERWRQ